MSDSGKIRVEGLSKLNSTLKKLGDVDTPKAIKEANLAAAKLVVAGALPHVPVGATGNLKRSVRALASPTSSRMKAGSKAVPYAAAIHWGTKARKGKRGPHNIKGRPFLWDAREKLIREVRDHYEKALHAVVDKVR